MKKTYYTPTVQAVEMLSNELIAISIVPDGEADPDNGVLCISLEWADSDDSEFEYCKK